MLANRAPLNKESAVAVRNRNNHFMQSIKPKYSAHRSPDLLSYFVRRQANERIHCQP